MSDLALLPIPENQLSRLLDWVRSGLRYYHLQSGVADGKRVATANNGSAKKSRASEKSSSGQLEEWRSNHEPLLAQWAPRGGNLARCIRQFSLSPEESFLLIAAGLTETDPDTTFLIHDLQQPDSNGSLSVHLGLELLGTLFGKEEPFNTLDLLESPLLGSQLLSVEGDRPLPLQTLRMTAGFWSVLCDRHKPWPVTTLLSAGERLLLPHSVRQSLPKLASMLQQKEITTLILRGHPDSGRHLMAVEVARLMGLEALSVPLNLWSDTPAFTHACAYARWLPVIQTNITAGEVWHLPRRETGQPAILVVNMDGAVAGNDCLEYQIGLPDAKQRQELWHQSLEDEELATQFSGSVMLSGSSIVQVAQSARRLAMQRSQPLGAEHIRQARHDRGAEKLRLLAQPVLRQVTPGSVVFPPLITKHLDDLVERARRRETLWSGLGSTLQVSQNTGLRALFVGESGTGKTLAASYLATQLGAPLYRVDLGAVMNKYVGESEKNLGLLLDQAAAHDVILLFDEADSLFGNRSDAKQAGERYANNLTNYLLSRIETHPGIALLTTNSRERIDAAFNRRIEIILDFPLPGFAERLRLWESHLGQRSPSPDVVRSLASHCDFAGGQIRNAVLTAAGSQSESGPIDARHLVAAVEREYQKLGRSLPSALAATKKSSGGDDPDSVNRP